MKATKKQQPEELITKSFFQSEMSKIHTEFKTIRWEMSEIVSKMMDGVQVMFDEQDRKNEEKFVMKDEFRAFKDQNLTMLDQIMVEIKAMREEQITGGYRQAQHTDQLDNHETRLTTLENHLDLAS